MWKNVDDISRVMQFLLELLNYKQLAIHLVRPAQEHTGYVGGKISERGLCSSGSRDNKRCTELAATVYGWQHMII